MMLYTGSVWTRTHSSFLRIAYAAVLVFITFQLFSLLTHHEFIFWISPVSISQRIAGYNVTGLTEIASLDKTFPRKIWQTSLNDFTSLSEEDKGLVKGWVDLNPTWRYESITPGTERTYVTTAFADKPEMLDIFLSLQDGILRADMLRYLVLLKEGGVYCDADTKALKPIHKWIPPEYQQVTNLVIGVEYDVGYGDHWADWTLDLQFTTTTILAKPNHPLLRQTINRLVENINGLASLQNTTVDQIIPSFSQVLDTTGPAMFSRTVYDYLSRNNDPFTWQNATRLQEPLLIEDILILPITAFSSGQKHSGARGPEDPSALVQHMFHGSWKHRHSAAEERRKKEAAKQSHEEAIEDNRKAEEELKRKGEEKRRKAAEMMAKNFAPHGAHRHGEAHQHQHVGIERRLI